MRALLGLFLGITLSGTVSADQYSQWVQEEFPVHYKTVQDCMPVTVEWTSQSNDTVWAEFERRQDGAIVLRTPFKVSKGAAASQPEEEFIVKLVDTDGDGTVNEATLEGRRTESGPAVEEDPIAARMLHTAVVFAANSEQCQH